MASAIDPAHPVDGTPASKSVQRSNWSAAKTEIEALQTDLADFAAVDDTGAADGYVLGRASGVPAWRSPAQLRGDAGVLIGTNVQAFDADLDALAGQSGTGLYARTGAGTGATRTLTAGSAKIAVGNGSGASANPTVDLGAVASTDLSDSATLYKAGGTDVALADGGTGTSLTDPNADRILFWDDSTGAVTWLTAGTGLTITGTTIDAAGGSGNVSKVGTPVNDQVGVWTGDGTLEGDVDLTFDGAGALSVQSTDAGSAEGPQLVLDRASATPAAGDLVGQVTFRGRDSAAAPTDYGKIRGVASEVANNTEASRLQFIVLDGIGNPAESFSVKGDGVIVYKDNNDALPGPTLTIQRHSDDPAVNDKLGLISWTGRDSAGNETSYASIETAIIDPTNGSEDGELRFSVTKAGGEPKLSAFLNHAGFFHFLEDAGGAGTGPEVAIFRDSTSPTNNDLLGQLLFQGRDSGGGGVDYAGIRAQILDVANTSEDGSLELRVAVAGTLTTKATLSASGLALASGTALTGLVETISGHVETAANKTYVLDLKAPYGYTVNALAAKTASGTCTAKLTIDGVDVTGIAALSVTSTEASATASAANTVAVDTTLALVVSANATALDLSFSVKITR